VKKRLASILGSFLFFWIAPATVAGVVPWRLTDWDVAPPLLGLAVSRWIGGVLVAAGAIVVVECFARFALEGLGTPAPLAPTEHLVVSGLYRFVRNPMYVGVVAAILGQALLLGRPVLLGYAALIWLAFSAFVAFYEEPTLRRQFGAEYDDYRAHVGRWWPRLTPWSLG
jgi:protein-S-isoprenylcysteine O-methyltransferase Ste14